jgi:hypothetical protein
MSSGVESFDEEDMYPMDYDDEAVFDSPDPNGELESPSRDTVCVSSPLSFPVSHICDSMIESFSRRRAFKLKWRTYPPWSWHFAMPRELALSPARTE